MGEINYLRDSDTGVTYDLMPKDGGITEAKLSDELQEKLQELELGIGSPLVASTAAEMTDTEKIYVYTGSETGYTSGNWYYYNGSAWTSGGVYNSMALETDKTLQVSGAAADAKVVGDEVTQLKEDLNTFGMDVYGNDLDIKNSSVLTAYSTESGYAISTSGARVSKTNSQISKYNAVPGKWYRLHGDSHIQSGSYGVYAFFSTGSWTSYIADTVYVSDNTKAKWDLYVKAPSTADRMFVTDGVGSGLSVEEMGQKPFATKDEIAKLEAMQKPTPLQNGGTNSSGERYNTTVFVTTGVLPYDAKKTVIVPDGIRVSLRIGETATSLEDRSYILQNGTSADIDDDPSNYHYFALNLRLAGGGAITTSMVDYCYILDKEMPESVSFHKLDALNNSNNATIYQLKMEQFYNTVTISDIEDTLAVSDGFDIDDLGRLCAGCVAADNAYSESGNPNWNGYLLTANLADVEKTKAVTDMYIKSSRLTALNGVIESVQNSIAKWTDADEITNIAKCVWRDVTEQTLQTYGIVAKKYTPSNEQPTDAELCTIKVGGTTYYMRTRYTLGTPKTINADDQAAIEAIWTATGIEHPTGYSGVNSYEYYLGNNPAYYNGYWYAPISLGNQSHALCKSDDMINWEFVCDIPFDQASEECCVCFYDGNCYATSRGNPNVDSQYSKVMMCDVSELDGEHWTTPIVLDDCRSERPTIIGLNNKIYVMQGRSAAQLYVEGVNIRRGNKRLYVFDTDLNLINYTDMAFKYPILHPQFSNYGGNMWICTSSDKRCLAFTKSGDTRAEISFGHMDDIILAM